MTIITTQHKIKNPFCLVFTVGFITGVSFFVGIQTGFNTSVPFIVAIQRGSIRTSATNHSNFKLLPQYTDRNQLTKLIVNENFTSGAEVGVQLGVFAEILLSSWPKCTEYHAIDLWAQQKSYQDFANVNNVQQEDYYMQTRAKLKRFKHIVRYHRNYSHLAVNEIKDESLDFIYLDARHDYVGVMEDLTLYWPKLKKGGVFAGHDYLDVSDVKVLTPEQDWSVDQRGVKRTDGKAAKSAVNEFASKHRRQILITLPEAWPTWYMRK